MSESELLNLLDTGLSSATSARSILIDIVIGIYLLIAEWEIIEKSGDRGWKALIPFYGSYVFMKACNSVACFWSLLIICAADVLLTVLIGVNTATLVILGISLILLLIIDIIICKNTAHAFGKGVGFAAGLFFLGPIFQGILAFGEAEHQNQNMISNTSSGGNKNC